MSTNDSSLSINTNKKNIDENLEYCSSDREQDKNNDDSEQLSSDHRIHLENLQPRCVSISSNNIASTPIIKPGNLSVRNETGTLERINRGRTNYTLESRGSGRMIILSSTEPDKKLIT